MAVMVELEERQGGSGFWGVAREGESMSVLEGGGKANE